MGLAAGAAAPSEKLAAQAQAIGSTREVIASAPLKRGEKPTSRSDVRAAARAPEPRERLAAACSYG
jgi:hypothetical protein